MKTIHYYALSVAMILLLDSCTKSTCHTCTEQCISYGVIDTQNGGQLITHGTYCGSASQIATYKSTLYSAYPYDEVDVSSTTPQTQSVCGTPDQTNSPIQGYIAAGYTCN